MAVNASWLAIQKVLDVVAIILSASLVQTLAELGVPSEVQIFMQKQGALLVNF